MKIKMLATGSAPTYYEIDGETVNGIDLSIIEYGGKFVGSADTRQAGIRNAERDDAGELWVTLKQEVGPGRWSESDWFDAENYDPDTVYVQFGGKTSGVPYAVTRRGKRRARMV